MQKQVSSPSSTRAQCSVPHAEHKTQNTLVRWLLVAFAFLLMGVPCAGAEEKLGAEGAGPSVKWVDFTPTGDVMAKALALDIATVDTDIHLDWVETLGYFAAKTGGKWGKIKDADMDKYAKARHSGQSQDALTQNLKYYPYYHTAYKAVLEGFVGHFRVQIEKDGALIWDERYGLKAFSPLAKGYPFSHYDDFGSSRTYGYRRRHLGHDMMAQVGTPVVAVESGTVTALGWNRYGGWRIGLSSADGTRYYYYAHLRKNRPFAEGLAEGARVSAGDVIGYVGRSGYSANENQNNIETPHLHFGMRLIFDEGDRLRPSEQSKNEIWIDTYEIVKLLQKNRSETVRDPDTKEHTRKYLFEERG